MHSTDSWRALSLEPMHTPKFSSRVEPTFLSANFGLQDLRPELPLAETFQLLVCNHLSNDLAISVAVRSSTQVALFIR